MSAARSTPSDPAVTVEGVVVGAVVTKDYEDTNARVVLEVACGNRLLHVPASLLHAALTANGTWRVRVTVTVEEIPW